MSLALIKVRCSLRYSYDCVTLLQKAGLELGDDVVTPVMAFYARAGDVARTGSILSSFVTGMEKLHLNHWRDLTATVVRCSQPLTAASPY